MVKRKPTSKKKPNQSLRSQCGYLNNDLKGQVNAAGLPDNKGALRSRMQGFMNKLRGLPQQVRNYFKHPCMLYAMAS